MKSPSSIHIEADHYTKTNYEYGFYNVLLYFGPLILLRILAKILLSLDITFSLILFGKR